MADIKDVAKLAGVSVATVSRTLDMPDLVAEATRQKVLRAVSECGYVANTLARNFRRRRSNTVLVLVPDIANPFFSSIIRGIEGVALAAGYRVLLGDTQNDPARSRRRGSSRRARDCASAWSSIPPTRHSTCSCEATTRSTSRPHWKATTS